MLHARPLGSAPPAPSSDVRALVVPRPGSSRPPPPRPRSVTPPPLPAPDPNATQELSVADLLPGLPPPLPKPPRVPHVDDEVAPSTERDPEPATPRIERGDSDTLRTVSLATRARARLAAARVAIVTFALFVSYSARAFVAFVAASLPHLRPRLRAEWERAERRSMR